MTVLFLSLGFHTGVKDLNDPKLSPINEVRYSLAICEMVRDEDENHVVNGTLLVFDCTGAGVKHMNQGGIDHNKKMSRIYQVQTAKRVISP